MKKGTFLALSMMFLMLVAVANVYAENNSLLDSTLSISSIVQKLNSTYIKLKVEGADGKFLDELNQKISQDEKLKSAISAWNGFDFSLDIQYNNSPIFQMSMIIDNSTVKSISLDATQESLYQKIYISADLAVLNTLAAKLNLLQSGKYEWWQWIVFVVWDMPSTFIKGIFTKDIVISPWYAGIYTFKWVQFFAGFLNLQEVLSNIQTNATVI